MNKVVWGIVVITFLTLVFSSVSMVASTEPDLVNPGFETGDLTGWSRGTVVDFAGVVSSDGYATPFRGNYMARLGTPQYNGQPVGSNVIYQEFTAVENTLKFAYNIFTYDFGGYNHFHYLVKDLTTNSTIRYFAQGAWGGGSGLKSTGWNKVTVPLSNYLGHRIRIEFDCGGTFDQSFSTWAYVDSTKPIFTTTATPMGTLGLNGWYISDVKVILKTQVEDDEAPPTIQYSFDAISWITYSAPFIISREGMTTIYYRSIVSGDPEPTKELTISIDKTPPAVTGAATTSPNANGWYNSNVMVHFSAYDNVSGVDSVTPDTTILTEGRDQSVTGTAIDKAGNRADNIVRGINIDKTPPETLVILYGTLNGSRYMEEVVVRLDASDALSGVASTLYSLDGSASTEYVGRFSVSSEGSHTVKFWSIDNAGNVEGEKSKSFDIGGSGGGENLEAVIAFDVVSKDITVRNSLTGDEASYVILDKKGAWEERKYTLEYLGRMLMILLKYKNEGKEITVKVINIQYDGGTILDAPKNELKVWHEEDKNKMIKELRQKIEINDLLEASANYNAKKDETEINSKLEGEKRHHETRMGIVLLKLLTQNGSLNYGGL